MRLAIGCAIAAVVMCVAQTTLACSCAPPPEPKKALADAAAVFVGKVTEVKRTGDQFSGKLFATFEVATTYKGVKTKTVEVGTAGNSAMCGYGFAKGESYIVYCYSSDEGKTLRTNICTRTRKASAAKGDIDALGEGEAVE